MLEKAFNPSEAEPRLYEMWEKSGAFKPRMDTSREAYSIVIPPPNVTGSLHMGHAVNNTLQDILIRTARMQGKDVLWQPGTDHAGIATQMVVERQLEAAGQRGRKDMAREEFIDKVWEWKGESGGIITEQLRRLGASCDWSREKFTLGNPDDDNDKMAEAVIKAFVDLYNDGLIYRGKRLVNWDPHFETAISDLEVENVEKDGFFWHFKYPLAGGETYTYVEKDEDGNITLEEERDYISIATTRPETMLGDGAVAVHPNDERYAPIVGKLCEIPVGPKAHRRLIPIITDDYPDPEFGSGAVKITGAHDENDYGVAQRNNIPLYSLMDTKAAMRSDGAPYAQVAARALEISKGADWDASEIQAMNLVPDEYRGLDRFIARKKVVADIDAEGLMIKVEDKKIMQPIGDRSGVVIEPMLTDQWFVDAEKLAIEAMAAVNNGRTEFYPANWKKTYDHWMENIQPWCISRQLWWGHRVPAWYGPSISKNPIGPMGHYYDFENPVIFSAMTEAEMHELAIDYYSKVTLPDGSSALGGGTNVVPDKATAQKNCDDPDGAGMYYVQIFQDPDVLDTWFSSGLWPFSTLGWPEETEELKRFYPGACLVTGFDIIFFWVARMMMQGIHFMDDVPFKDVYTHALVLDEQGKKMSKSEGNVIDPLDLIQGIDIDALVAKRTKGLRQPEKAPQVEKATRKQYPDGFEAYGADALRFTLASMAGMGRNIKLSVDRVAGYRNFGTKLWNATKFGQMNGCAPVVGFDPASATLSLNRWIIGEAHKAAAQVTDEIAKYRFNDAADSIYKFAWGTFCDWYIELVKPVLSGDDGADKDETRATFSYVLDVILKLLHPFMPFITEEIWQSTGEREGMLILADWPEAKTISNDDASDDVNWLVRFITSVRSVRAEMNVPPSKKGPAVLIGASEAVQTRMEKYGEVIERMARIDGWSIGDSAPQGALQTPVDEMTVALPLAGLIDLDAERDRLSKQIDKLKADIEKLDRKLSNEGFLAKAPAAVVEKDRNARAALAADMDKLTEALTALG